MVGGCPRSGVVEWLIQRITALMLGVYAIFIVAFWWMHAPMTFSDWQALWSHTSMRWASLLVMVALLWHAWIGLWTVLTDYVKPRNVRLALLIAIVALMLLQLVWLICILWP